MKTFQEELEEALKMVIKLKHEFDPNKAEEVAEYVRLENAADLMYEVLKIKIEREKKK